MLQRPTKPGVESSNLSSRATLRVIAGGGAARQAALPVGRDFVDRLRPEAELAARARHGLSRAARRFHRKLRHAQRVAAMRRAFEDVAAMFARPIREGLARARGGAL